jgi:hypothetical protein
VNNINGAIGGSATDFVTATGDVNVGEETFFNIFNSNGGLAKMRSPLCRRTISPREAPSNFKS